MIVHYIVRDVTPDAARRCSYPPGRTLLNRGPCYTDPDRAEADARRANECCGVAGVAYSAVAWEETVPFPADRYEQP